MRGGSLRYLTPLSSLLTPPPSVITHPPEFPLDHPRIVHLLVELVEEIGGHLEAGRLEVLDVAEDAVDRGLLRLEDSHHFGEHLGRVTATPVEAVGDPLDGE